MTSPACYTAALVNHTLLLPDEEAVQHRLEQQPDSLDAVVVFPQALAAAKAAPAAAASAQAGDATSAPPAAPAAAAKPAIRRGSSQHNSGSGKRGQQRGPVVQKKQLVGCGAPGPPSGDGLMLDYVIRMNSSDIPPTQLLQDLFDVSPGIMPVPGNLLW